ncbi:Glu/Leu/Phe/Val dehydrogenase [Actinomadura viridis]|uniref:Glu/Leu/Phe/Val family dehydrogenase n=1 Tax=Actinomadura viridis TaxID=58110 RepID=UPI00369A0E98
MSTPPGTADALDLMDEWGPEKVVCVSDTRTGMRGVLVVDNTARGPGKGGTRMGPGVGVTEVARLARVMTWKWAAADLFFGGAKAGIRFDPASADKEAALRAFARSLRNEVPREYVLGLDMGLTEADAAIVQDELGDRGAAVGTPHVLGGVPYDELGVTGFGVAEAADAAAQRLGLDLGGARVSIQGFGAVGAAAARRLHELGATIVAISTRDGVLYDPAGLDLASLLALRAHAGDGVVSHYVGGSRLVAGEELTVPAEIVVPAATQDTIDLETAKAMKARLVVEGANLPTSAEAREYFRGARITVLPDFIANAGGAVAAATAMDARYSAFRPDPEAILSGISTLLRRNTAEVLEAADRGDTTPHQAAMTLARERVHKAMRLKGRLTGW